MGFPLERWEFERWALCRKFPECLIRLTASLFRLITKEYSLQLCPLSLLYIFCIIKITLDILKISAFLSYFMKVWMGYSKSPLTGITTARGPIFSLVFLLRNTENIFLNLFAAEYLEETQLTELEEIIRQDNGAVSLIRQSRNFWQFFLLWQSILPNLAEITKM